MLKKRIFREATMNKQTIGAPGLLVGGVVALLCASALQFPAFGDEILFANAVNTANGNCAFQCVSPQTFAADNFILTRNSTIERIDFTGIRTGSNLPAPPSLPNLNFTTTVDVEFFNFDPSWTNSFTSQPFGSLIASYTGLTAIQTGASFPLGPSEAFIPFEVDLPGLSLHKGQYWLALHADISGGRAPVEMTPRSIGTLDSAMAFGPGICLVHQASGQIQTLPLVQLRLVGHSMSEVSTRKGKTIKGKTIYHVFQNPQPGCCSVQA
jgi:hypothetical protein